MFYFLISSLVLYILLIITFAFKSRRKQITGKHKPDEKVSVIIAFKDEEKNLSKLLTALKEQDYPQENIEYIFINDRSTDMSLEILKDQSKDFYSIKILSIETLPENSHGKKNALKKGIDESSNDILIMTDADCIPEKTWISRIVKLYSSDTMAVIGNAPLIPSSKKFIPFFQRAENHFNHIVTYISYIFNYPLMSFGRNFSYRKAAFRKVGEFSEINKSVSGDDDLLLSLFKKNRFKISYSTSNVSSGTVNCLSEYIRQKTRHISAARFIPLKLQILMGIIQLFNLLFYFCIIIGFYKIFLIKILMDFILFRYVSIKIGLKLKFLDFILWELFYPFFIVILTSKGYFTKIRHIKWK